MVSPGRGRSPQFMRSLRNRPALRRRSNLAVFMQLSLISLGIAMGGFIGWLGNEYVQRNETFRVRQFHIDEVPQDLQLAVATMLQPAMGANLLTIDLDWVHRQVQTIPAVQTTTVRRVFPDTVHVSVRVREAFAVLEAQPWTRAVSRDGVVLGAEMLLPAAHLPVVRVAGAFEVGSDRRLRGALARRFEDAASLLEWLPQADPDLYRRLDHLRVEPRGVVAVLDAPHWEIIFGDASRLDAKLAGMVSILKRELPAPRAVIDLRYAHMVVVGAADNESGSEE